MHGQSSNLEQVIIPIWSTKSSTLVDIRQVRYHMIVESIKGDQQGADAWRETQHTLLAEGIRLEFPIDKCSYAGLIFVATTIEGSEVEVGGGIGDTIIAAVGVEKIYT
jgi:hypothetical protein